LQLRKQNLNHSNQQNKKKKQVSADVGPKPKGPKGKHEAPSKYAPEFVEGSDMHRALIKLYCDDSMHPDKYFGTAFCGKHNDAKMFFINKHQFGKTTYVIDASGKKVFLPADKFKVFRENGEDSILAAPLSDLNINFKNRRYITVQAINPNTEVHTLVGIHPDGEREFVVSTPAVQDGKYITHSASTTDYVCGAYLFDASRNCAVGLHTRSNGPNSNGMNNQVVSFF